MRGQQIERRQHEAASAASGRRLGGGAAARCGLRLFLVIFFNIVGRGWRRGDAVMAVKARLAARAGRRRTGGAQGSAAR